ncbi:Uncharacterised protein [Mycobacteroides abscessus subsp. abscessus]|nr:Uncharacterised protein [Mycobacteroides abscessus subsp. abscessus]
MRDSARKAIQSSYHSARWVSAVSFCLPLRSKKSTSAVSSSRVFGSNSAKVSVVGLNSGMAATPFI